MNKVNNILAWIAGAVIVFMITTTAKDYIQIEKQKLNINIPVVVQRDSVPYAVPQIVIKYIKAKKITTSHLSVTKDTTGKTVYVAWGSGVSVDYDTVSLKYNSVVPLQPSGWFSDIVVHPHPIWQYIDTVYVPHIVMEPHSPTWDYIYFGAGIFIGAEAYHILTK